MRDAASDAVERRGSLLTRLLMAIAEQRAAANERLKTIETEARASYEEAIATSHGPVLHELADRLSQQIRRYVPAGEIKLEPAAAGFSIEPPRVDLRGGEERDITDLGRQGHGFQRAFVISALEYLAESDAEGATDRPTLLLAIEEPKLSPASTARPTLLQDAFDDRSESLGADLLCHTLDVLRVSRAIRLATLFS